MQIHHFARSSSVAEVKAYIDEWGFAVVDGIGNLETIEGIRRDVERYGRAVTALDLPFFGGALKKVEGLAAKSAGLIELMDDPFVIELSEAYLGPDVLLNASGGFILEKGRKPQPLHHDDVLYKPFFPRFPGGAECMVNFMYAVTDFTPENGATRMVPKSHLWPEGREPGPDDEVVDVAMKRGSVAIWLGSTWHGAGLNTTDTPRLGAEMAFNCGWLRPHEAYHLLVPPALARDYPVRVQEVLGYKAHRGMLGCIEQRSPMELFGFAKQTGSARAVVRDADDPAASHVDSRALEATVKGWFAKSGTSVPAEVGRLLKGLEDANAKLAAATSRSDHNMLEVVAEAQARLVVEQLRSAGLSEPVEALKQAEN